MDQPAAETGPVRVPGTEGYAETAAVVAQRYEEITFDDVHASVRHLIPTAPPDVLDIGAGTGRDAAALAAMGHRVVAVEPTAELRAIGTGLHPSDGITWLDDSLPDLALVTSQPRRFDAILLTAVWMHLDDGRRTQAMPVIANLLRPGGIVLFSVRHGPVPAGRVMYEIPAEETIDLAATSGLRLLLRLDDQPGAYGARGDPRVTWTKLVFAQGQARRPCPLVRPTGSVFPSTPADAGTESVQRGRSPSSSGRVVPVSGYPPVTIAAPVVGCPLGRLSAGGD